MVSHGYISSYAWLTVVNGLLVVIHDSHVTNCYSWFTVVNSGYQFLVMVIRLCIGYAWLFVVVIIYQWLMHGYHSSDVNSWSLFLLMSNSSYQWLFISDYQ